MNYGHPKGYIAKPETDYVHAQVWEEGRLIADIYGESRQTRKDDAQLFAASREMYQALTNLVALAEAYLRYAPSHPDNAKLEDARAALVKARGEK